MPVHPAPPADIPSLIEAYRAVVTSFAGVADGLRDSDWDRPTTCPGWTARDHLAHVVHVEDVLSGSEHPIAGWSEGRGRRRKIAIGSPAHVRNDFGVWIEEGVQARRESDPSDLIADLRGIMEVRSSMMYDPDLTMDTLVPSVMGEQATFEEITRLRLADIWVHEQDLREVVGRPGSLDTAGASQWTEFIMDALTRIVLRRVKPEPGTVVILETTGPVQARAGVRVGLDEDGTLVGHELFSGHVEPGDDVGTGPGAGSHQQPAHHIPPEQTTTISLSTHALTRRAAGRHTTQETAYQVVGDEELARQVLEAYALTP